MCHNEWLRQRAKVGEHIAGAAFVSLKFKGILQKWYNETQKEA